MLFLAHQVGMGGSPAADVITQAVTQFQTPADHYATQAGYNIALARHQRQVTRGSMNNILHVTLTANAAATTVTDARIGANTVALCIPMTATASAIAQPYRDFVNPVDGSMSLIHANDANADKTFKVLLFG